MEQGTFQGEELQIQREVMGLSREDVFRKLRISLEFIERIETGQLLKCPANTYTVGFIKSYCDFLEMNPEPYINELTMAQSARKGLSKQTLTAEPAEQPLWFREAVMWGGVIGIIILGWVTFSVVFHPSTPEHSSRVSADSVDTRIPKFPMR